MNRKIAGQIGGLMVALVLALICAGPAQAADDTSALIPGGDMALTPSTTKGPLYNQSEAELRMRKLARGVCNVTLCVAEIPNQMFREASKTTPVTGVIVGGVKGIGKGIERFAVGIWEVATFYHPGTNHYQPLIEPEVVMQDLSH